MVPVLVLLLVALWFILRGDLFYVLPCVILFLCFSIFSIAITSLVEERANLSVFRTFVRFSLVWFLSVSSSSWCLGRSAVCDCGSPCTFLLPLFVFFFFSFHIWNVFHSQAHRRKVSLVNMLFVIW